ncbi:undecaprenyl-diphosphate phosphatase [Colwellia sp. Arc7-635]|jgi:undecaprenyl-diphosphatase|uniref:undecaprenyl-diphosphate phosphatase n=1 Tax=Colwellia sp. Arc7-635 TaxID=2497879 RepID=UPI000F854931|nr:undecaprenyl-diphosphate phosphatase [Colwellia sp. Arc7-635]AZQ83280.1 undecaprenyl-diphosphate phosphatase [Colwellia sp. Arc7-635]
MSTIDVFILAIIQGLTEFLPISSSAHLILPSAVFGWEDQGQALDVALHVGTLLAVVLYFRKEVGSMAVAWFGTVGIGPEKNNNSFDGKLAWWILLASIPLGIVGLLGKDFIEENLRTAAVIAITTLVFGVLLGFADIKAKENVSVEKLGFKGAMIIGLAQALALIPGTSRSGITMTLGLMLGLNKENAARFSFLLSIPAIVMTGGYLTYKLISSAEAVDWSTLGLGSVLAFFSAYACIHYFLILVNKIGMMPFVIYRLLLGAGLLWFVLG